MKEDVENDRKIEDMGRRRRREWRRGGGDEDEEEMEWDEEP